MNQLMEYQGYHAKIEYSAEDESFVGRVIGVNDVLLFDGETVDELTAVFHEMIDDYLEMCKEYDREPDKEYKGSLNVRMDPELHRKAALRAEAENISLNKYICQAVSHEIIGRQTSITTIILQPQTAVYDVAPCTEVSRFKKEGFVSWKRSNAIYNFSA